MWLQKAPKELDTCMLGVEIRLGWRFVLGELGTLHSVVFTQNRQNRRKTNPKPVGIYAKPVKPDVFI